MSYILDALRRADAERERGAVPGLHTQQFGVLPDDEAPRRPRLLIATVVLLALALTGVLAWTVLAPHEPASRTATQGQVAPAPASPGPTPPSLATTEAPAQPLALALPAASSPSLSLAPPALPARARQPLPPRAERPPTRREVPVAAATAPLGERVYALADLPEPIRRELPKLAFGGASYSGDKASRMVILNGQVFHEGDTVGPGLVLKQIRQKGAVLAYKSYRYEVSF